MARNYVIVDDSAPKHRRFLNGGTALSEGDMVVLSSGALAEVADDCTTGIVGICAEDIAASSYGTVYISGVFKGTAASGVNFAIGDKVYAAGADTLDAGSQNDVCVGKVVHTDPSAGGTVYFELWSIIDRDITAHAG